ncbi:hypothetical protein SteCoe_31394 [Stentor coeruleus]|uniref:U2A'/phosphoprotein 32 family A C-terminal domain-containing protein n=1 Tax=Stentor coeruleus TaxID=5963 RepID=A0A1R2B1M8_9CILI|nr:hypothetical protein SteCoe_31394 [Stentor coeruleus]
MEGIIKQQVKGCDSEEVYELILDKYRGLSISLDEKLLLETFTNLESLSITGCGLKSLDNFPALPKLLRLELCDNRLRNNLKSLLVLPSLTMLSLAGNQISSLEELEILSPLTNLASIDLFNCPVTLVNGYSEKVFAMFKNLQVLDGVDKNGEEVSVASEDEEDEEEDDDDEDLNDFILYEDDDDDVNDEPVKKSKINEDSDLEGDLKE